MLSIYDLPVLIPASAPPGGAILAAGAVAEPTAGAPLLVSAGDQPAAMTAQLVSFPDRTLIGELTVVGQTFEDVAGDVGAGSVVLDRIDPVLASVDEGQLIDHYLYGQLAFTSVVETLEDVEITENEEAGELTTIAGRGVLSILEQGLVYPLLFGAGPTGTVELDRVFNWSSIDFPDSGWAAATELVQPSTLPTLGLFDSWLVNGRFPAGWPEPTAWWVWSRPVTLLGVPEGSSYFRKTFTLADPAQVRIYIAADDGWDLWVDGSQVQQSEPFPAEAWSRTQHVDVSLAAGDHALAIRATNYPFVGLNIAGLIVAAYTIDQRSKDVDDLLFVTDSSWRAVDYPPSPPGFTPGQIIETVIGEAQTRGALTMLTLGFDGTVDSAGQPWPVVTDLATRIGTDLLTFIVSEMGSAYVDVRLSVVDFRLDAWIKGHTEPTTVALDPADPDDPRTGSLRQLVRRFG